MLVVNEDYDNVTLVPKNGLVGVSLTHRQVPLGAIA